MDECCKLQRVVVIDDDPAIARLLGEILTERCGVEVVIVDESSAILPALDGSEELVLIDVEFGREDGRVWARRIRASGHRSPIVFVTGRPDKISCELLSELSPADVIAKPFSVWQVLALMPVGARDSRANDDDAHLTRETPMHSEASKCANEA